MATSDLTAVSYKTFLLNPVRGNKIVNFRIFLENGVLSSHSTSPQGSGPIADVTQVIRSVF